MWIIPISPLNPSFQINGTDIEQLDSNEPPALMIASPSCRLSVEGKLSRHSRLEWPLI